MPGVVEASAAIALGVLAVAGVAKLIDPAPASGALSASGLPGAHLLVRLLGAGELAAATVGLSFGGSAAAPAAGLYLGFALFSVRALRNDAPLQSCGCFGRGDTPPSAIHVAYNVIATAALAVVAMAGLSSVPWQGPALETAVYLGFVGLGAYASMVLLTRLPAVKRVARAR